MSRRFNLTEAVAVKVAMKFILALSIVPVGFVTTGCDLGTYAQRAEQASAGYQPAVEPAAKSTAGNEDAASPAVGKWSINGPQTASASRRGMNPVLLGGAANVQKKLDELRDATMDFNLLADGTFTSSEVIGQQSASGKGNWKLNGDRIVLTQTHQDGRPVADKMEGTVEGTEMRLTHRQPGAVTTFALRKTGK